MDMFIVVILYVLIAIFLFVAGVTYGNKNTIGRVTCLSSLKCQWYEVLGKTTCINDKAIYVLRRGDGEKFAVEINLKSEFTSDPRDAQFVKVKKIQNIYYVEPFTPETTAPTAEPTPNA